MLDTLRVFGLGNLGKPTEASVVVLRFPEGKMVGFCLDRVGDIRFIPKDAIVAMPPLAVRDPSIFRGVHVSDDGQTVLVLSVDGIHGNYDLAQFAALSRVIIKPAVGLSRSADTTSSSTEPYLVCNAGGEIAVPLAQVEEIVSYPTDSLPIVQTERQVLGLFTHRGKAIPLLPLSRLLGRPTVLDQTLARVLLVTLNDHTTGLVVESLGSIESARKRSTRGEASGEANRGTPVLGEFMAEFVSAGKVRLIPHVNPRELLAKL